MSLEKDIGKLEKMMSDRIELTPDMMYMHASLIEAIEETGGNIPWEGLHQMTVLELERALASNLIRFVY